MRGPRPRAGFKPSLPALSEGAGDRLRPLRIANEHERLFGGRDADRDEYRPASAHSDFVLSWNFSTVGRAGLTDRYGRLRLRSFAVVSLDFERLVGRELTAVGAG